MTQLADSAPRAHGPRSEALHRRAMRERIPVIAAIELTHRCNLACVHCYVNLAPNDREAQRRELTTEEFFRIIDEMADAGTLWVTLTGGEPLLRPDFCDIYSYAHKKGLLLSVYTNATLITERHLELWRKQPPRVLEITQYGFTRETYDTVTDVGPQFDRFHRGLARVRDAGLPVTLKAMAMRLTVDEIPAIHEFANAGGMQFRFDAVISPRIDGGRKPLAQRLTPTEVAAIEVDGRDTDSLFASYCADLEKRPRDDRRYQCGAGLTSFTIDPYGKMHVCQLSRRPGWDVLRDGFRQGFDVEFAKLRAETRTDMSGCGTCATAAACTNCTGMAELEGRSLDDGDPYFCNITDARGELAAGAARKTPNGLVKLRLRGEHG
ncbi:MAG: putative Fe-S oxidoreductase [Acidobacteria bacterium]|nr:putative Fe-S oxidoreductase [Acidobacteriota bacterium]